MIPLQYKLAAVSVAIVALVGYNVWENSTIRKETREVVEAEAMRRTAEAISEVNNAAEKARAMRRYCTSNGKLYDFETGRCRDN